VGVQHRGGSFLSPTEVFLVLRGHNDNNVLGIDYRSKEYYPLAEDKQDTDILNKL
jgi:hypothetical protein